MLTKLQEKEDRKVESPDLLNQTFGNDPNKRIDICDILNAMISIKHSSDESTKLLHTQNLRIDELLNNG